jgi:hypothetical protein
LAEWIGRFKAELKRQKAILIESDLEHELLVLYKANGQWEEFLDGYLELLGACPAHPVVANWAPFALTYSLDYGRTDEVLDALQHIARFQRNPYVTSRVKGAVDKWLAEHHP